MVILLEMDEIKKHPMSSWAECILFFYSDRLFTAPHFAFTKLTIHNLISDQIPLQKLTKTDFVLNHPKYGKLQVFENKYYKPITKIQDSCFERKIDFIKTICNLNIHLINKQYILRDIHEGNIYDTTDGILWLDWGAIGHIDSALASLALTMYLVNKYIYNLHPHETNETYNIVKARNTSSPVQYITELDPKDIATWIELSRAIH